MEQEIATANKLLKETSKNKQATLNQVNLLDKKIKQREELVKAYNEQIAVLDDEISKGQSNIKALNGDLKNLRKEYAQMIVFANKNRSHYDKLVFLFPPTISTRPSGVCVTYVSFPMPERPKWIRLLQPKDASAARWRQAGKPASSRLPFCKAKRNKKPLCKAKGRPEHASKTIEKAGRKLAARHQKQAETGSETSKGH